MKIHEDIKKFSAGNPVVTVGIFDGVHLGHRLILRKLREAAGRLKGESVLVTLWPHPRTILNQVGNEFRLLNTMEEKILILEEEGLDHLIVIPFTHAFSRLSSREFIQEYLVEKIGIRHLVVGFNHRFGRDREGDYDKLWECAAEFGFGIEKVPSFVLDSRQVSSSRIRKCLLGGDVSRANELLGYRYSLSGQVVGGSRLGSSIGFPTANITPDREYKLIPANGVYAVKALLGGIQYRGMLNIGTRPTVNSDPSKLTIEVYLIDFESNIYSEQIRIDFVSKLRDEQKFSHVDALRNQLIRDRESTRELFRKLGEE